MAWIGLLIAVGLGLSTYLFEGLAMKWAVAVTQYVAASLLGWWWVRRRAVEARAREAEGLRS
jgi:hypothetical protein